MNNESLRRSLVYAAVMAALGLPSGVADAVVYSSPFDPVNFSGVATFDVSNACLLTNGFHSNNAGGCAVNWTAATVTLTDSPYTDTFNYSAFLPDPYAVLNIWVDNFELAGVNSNKIGPVIVTGHGTLNRPWWIQYEFTPSPTTPGLGDGFAPLAAFGPGDGTHGFGLVNLFTGSCDGSCTPNLQPSAVANVESFTRISQAVPEPGTLGLILGALGSGWFARRRKKAKPAD